MLPRILIFRFYEVRVETIMLGYIHLQAILTHEYFTELASCSEYVHSATLLAGEAVRVNGEGWTSLFCQTTTTQRNSFS